jgi:CspA family cold shock protein
MQVVGENDSMRVTGKVKWFNQFKGYGFIEVEDIDEDIFLHFSVIDQSGIKQLNSDDVIICDIKRSNRGFQVSCILEIVSYNKYETENSEPKVVKATMRWFNPAKGFGFARLNSGEDIFIHSNLLKKYRLETIEHGQEITLTIHHTNFGYEAVDIIIPETVP